MLQCGGVILYAHILIRHEIHLKFSNMHDRVNIATLDHGLWVSCSSFPPKDLSPSREAYYHGPRM
jgi:hypothetical protein